MNKQRRERRPLPLSTLLVVAAIGAISGRLACVIGRGTILGIGIGLRVSAHWYRKRHGLPR